MKKIVCEMCNSTDLVKQDGLYVCQYCGTKYSIEEARKLMVDEDGVVTVKVDDSSKIDNYLAMAQRALDSSNNKEAESYCNKILEVDQSNYRAWIIKSQAAGWQTTLAVPRLDEALSCLEKAINAAPEEELEAVAAEANDIMQNLLLATAMLQLNMITGYPDSNKVREYMNLKMDLLTKGITVQVSYGTRMKAINASKPEGEQKPLTSFGCLKFTDALEDKEFNAAIKVWNDMMARYKEDKYPIDYIFEECSKTGLVAMSLLGILIPNDISKVAPEKKDKTIKYIKNMITMKDTYGGLKSYTTSFSNGYESHPVSKFFTEAYKKQLAEEVTELRNKALQLDPDVVIPKTQSELEAEKKAAIAQERAEKNAKKAEIKANRNHAMVWILAVVEAVLSAYIGTFATRKIYGLGKKVPALYLSYGVSIIVAVVLVALLAYIGFTVIGPKKKKLNMKGLIIRTIIFTVINQLIMYGISYALGIYNVGITYAVKILCMAIVFAYADKCELIAAPVAKEASEEAKEEKSEE